MNENTQSVKESCVPSGGVVGRIEFAQKGFMPRIDRAGHPMSRDYYHDIDCSAVGCLFNREKKCSVPSLAKIGDDGRCVSFKAKIHSSNDDAEVLRGRQVTKIGSEA